MANANMDRAAAWSARHSPERLGCRRRWRDVRRQRLRDAMMGRLALAAFLALAASPALAGNAINGISQKFWRNANSIAVMAYVTGDDDTNAVVRLWQRQVSTSGSPAYDTGMVMVRRPGTHIYAGRVLYLPEGATAQFYSLADDGGTPQQTAADTASCSRYHLPSTSGTQYYVDQVLGNDGNVGTSPGSGAKKTIGSAVTKLTSDNAPTGSVINVAIGEYHESVVLSGATDGREYTLLGASRDSTIICGANPNVEQGRRDGTNAIVWTHLVTNPDPIAQTELASDSVYWALFPAAGGCGDSLQLVILGFGEYIHRKTSLWGMMRDSTLTSGCRVSSNAGELSGWYWSGDTLYVKRANGQAPPVSGNHFGYIDLPLNILHRNWTVRNLTVRYAGGTRTDNLNTEDAFKAKALLTGGNVNPGLNGHGILIGGSTHNASGARIINCTVYGTNSYAIQSPKFVSGGRADSCTVAGCFVTEFNLANMAYPAQKCRAEENMDACFLAGQSTSVFDNTFSGSKGVVQASYSLPSADSSWGSYSEYSGNTVSSVIDDGIEVDNSPDINVLVYDNQVMRSTSGFSAITGYYGPVFVFFNTLHASTNGVKMGFGNTCVYNIYHNTILMNPLTSPNGFRATSCVGGFANHYYFRNNIFGTNGAATVDVRGVSAGVCPTGDSCGWHTNEFNWNGYQLPSGGANAATWVSASYTVAGLASSLGWEKNGKEIVGSLNLVDQANGDVRPLSTSGAVNAGMRISGVNAAWGANRYNTLPDLGAHFLDVK